MGTLTDDQIKAIYKTAGVDFSRGDTWRVPIYRRARYVESSNTPELTPPEEMYVEFRLEDGAFGIPGSMGHRVTRVVGRGVVVEEIHHRDTPVFIPLERP